MWEQNLHHIQQHNREEWQGKHSYRLAMNRFGALVPAATFPAAPPSTQSLTQGIRDILMLAGLDPGSASSQPTAGAGLLPGGWGHPWHHTSFPLVTCRRTRSLMSS